MRRQNDRTAPLSTFRSTPVNDHTVFFVQQRKNASLPYIADTNRSNERKRQQTKAHLSFTATASSFALILIIFASLTMPSVCSACACDSGNLLAIVLIASPPPPPTPKTTLPPPPPPPGCLLPPNLSPMTPSDGLGFGTPVAAAPVMATGGRPPAPPIGLAFAPGLTVVPPDRFDDGSRSPMAAVAPADTFLLPSDFLLAVPVLPLPPPTGDDVLLEGFFAIVVVMPPPPPPALAIAAATAAAAAAAPADMGTDGDPPRFVNAGVPRETGARSSGGGVLLDRAEEGALLDGELALRAFLRVDGEFEDDDSGAGACLDCCCSCCWWWCGEGARVLACHSGRRSLTP